MKYKKYPSYKDSELEWLGKIPSEWTNSKLKYHSFIYNGNSISDNEKENYENLDITSSIPYVSTKDIDSNFLTIDYDNGMRVPICNDKFKIAKKGSTLICIEGGSAGKKLSFLDKKVCFVNKLACIDSYKGLDKRFSNYIVRSSIFNYLFNLATTGLIPGVSINQLKDFEIILPSIQEQQQMANFLDKATAKIDTLIEKQTKLIELLKEKRQAVISHAVTKGINLNVKMKDSGVEWLGEIPEHWIRTKIKNKLSIPITDGPHETPEFLDEGVPFISAEAISSGIINFDKKRGCIKEEQNTIYSRKYTPKKFDVYMIKSGATTGVTAIVETDMKFNIWSPLAVFRAGLDLNPYYLLNFLRSINFQIAVQLNWSFGTQQNIGMNVLENLYIAVPPLEEQEQIANYLDDKTSKMDKLIEKANKSIELLKEKRTALISAAVTGKIDVRELV